MWLSILVLILGVAVLSAKKVEVPLKPKVLDGDEGDEEDATNGPESIQLPTLRKQSMSRNADEISEDEDEEVVIGRNGAKSKEGLTAYDHTWEGSPADEEDDATPRVPNYREDDFGKFVGDDSSQSDLENGKL